MTTPLTVIIPSFNRPAATEKALACVCAETPSDTEIFLVDDASIPPLARPDDPRVRVIRHEQNRGAAAARNTGLAAARGEWIALLDSDDVWPAGTFEQRWSEARADRHSPPLTVFASAFKLVGPGGIHVRRPMSSFDPLWFASGCWFCPGSTGLFRREPVIGAIGLQDESLRRLEDLDWFLRLALAGGGVKASSIVGARIARGARASPAAVETARTHLLSKYAPLPAPLQRRLRAYLDIERAAAALGDRRPLRAAACLARSWLAVPRARLQLEPFWR